MTDEARRRRIEQLSASIEEILKSKAHGPLRDMALKHAIKARYKHQQKLGETYDANTEVQNTETR